MSLGAIAGTKPGQQLPEALRKKLLENNPAMIGYATLNGGKLDYMAISSKDFKLEETLVEIEDKFKSHELLLWFTEDELDEDEQQPVVLVADKDDNPVLIAFGEGDFAKYQSDTAEFSPFYEFCRQNLGDRCQDLYDNCGGDFAKMSAILDGPAFHKALADEGHLQPRSVVAMIGLDGRVLMFSYGNGEAAEVKTPWGFASNYYGYTEPKAAADTPPVEKKLSFEERQAARKAAKGQATVNPPAAMGANAQKETLKLPPTSVPTAGTKDAPVAAPTTTTQGVSGPVSDGKVGIVDEMKKMIFPPVNARGRDLRKWYERHHSGGSKAVNWQTDRPGIPFDKLDKSSHWYDRYHPVAIARRNKDTAPHHIPQPDAKATDTPTTSNVTVNLPLDATDISKTVAIAKESSPMTFEAIKTAREKATPFSKRIQRELADILLWSKDRYALLPDHAKNELIDELRHRILFENPHLLKQPDAKPEEKPAEIVEKKLTFEERQAARKAKKVA